MKYLFTLILKFMTMFALVAGASLVVATPASAHSSAPSAGSGSACSTQVLRQGSRGACVSELQTQLVKLGYRTRATGFFGGETLEAVKASQRDNGLRADGIAGPLTQSMLAKPGPATASKTVTGPTVAPPSITLPAGCTNVKKSVCISMTDRKLRYVVDGTVQMTLDARFGGRHFDPKCRCVRDYPSSQGTFKVYWKSIDHKSSKYGNAPMPYSMFFNGGEAVHYSPTFARDGYGGSSHGCTNLRDWSGAKRLFEQVQEGTRVVVYK